MRVKLLANWGDHTAGDELDLDDAIGQALITTEQAEKMAGEAEIAIPAGVIADAVAEITKQQGPAIAKAVAGTTSGSSAKTCGRPAGMDRVPASG